MADMKSLITQSVGSGSPLPLEYDAIVPATAQGPVVRVAVDIDQTLDSPYLISGLLGGQTVFGLFPAGFFTSVTLSKVAFNLFTATRTVGSVSCYLRIGDPNTGISWPIATIDSQAITVHLTDLAVVCSSPQDPKTASLAVTAGGYLTVGTLQLDVTASFPDESLQIFLPPGETLGLSDLFKRFGYTPGKKIDALVISELDFSVDVASESVYLAAVIQVLPDPSAPALVNALQILPPLPGRETDGPALALSEIAAQISVGGGDVSATFGGVLLCFNQLVLAVRISVDRKSGTWTFDIALDVPRSWALLNPGSTSSGPYAVTLANLAHLFVPGSSKYLPNAISGLGIASLTTDYTYTEGGSSSYSFTGALEDSWTLDGTDIAAEVAVTVGSGGQNQVSADFSMDGFRFNLTHAFGTSPDTIFSINATVNGQPLSVSGTYSEENGATVRFQNAPSFATLIAWFVGEVTGNRHYVLPSPWDDILGQVEIPSGTSFTFDPKKKTVSCNYSPASSVDFFGLTISQVTLGYAPPSTGGSGITFTLDYSYAGESKSISWDPATQQPPSIPGHGSSVIDIRLLAAGQHVGFKGGAPTTVQTAVADIATALADWGSGKFLPGDFSFMSSAGWLLGAHARFLGQVDVQLVFADPQIYGLTLQIQPSGRTPPTKLDLLTGLFAEILYRKVSATVGEYEGMLTPPTTIGKINYGAVEIGLPSISVAIYTNGDFFFDVGFPYNLDFSHSVSVAAGEYAGAGGIYYGKLDGLDPSTLPAIDPTKGTFDPVTEIGVGCKVGLQRGFSSGPLSAFLSVTIEALFQGTFAKFALSPTAAPALYPNGGEEEYYDIAATVAIVGRLVGRIDFFIITATLEVDVLIRIDLDMVADQQSVLEIAAGVEVEVTVGINCGLFTIHIHCRFSTHIHTQASFGQTTTGLWDYAKVAAPPSSHGPMMSLLESPMLAAPAPAPAPTTIPVGWQPITDTNPLTIYFLPQATAGEKYPLADPKTGPRWYYVWQLGLSNGGTGYTNSAPSYANFVQGVLRWALNAINNSGGTTPVARSKVDGNAISSTDLQAFLDLFGGESGSGTSSPPEPAVSDVQLLFKNGFQTTVKAPATSGGAPYRVGFFPFIPGMMKSLGPPSIGGPGSQEPEMLPAAQPVSGASLQQARAARSANGVSARYLDHLHAPPPLPAASASVCERVLVEYIMLVVRTAMKEALHAFPGGGGTSTIGAVVAALTDDQLSSIAGMTTRFMLHGAKVPMPGGTPGSQPLYAGTGQQVPVSSAAVSGPSLLMGLHLQDHQDWGFTFANDPNNTGKILVGSAPTNQSPAPLLFPPQLFQQPPAFVKPVTPTLAALPIAHTAPQLFRLKSGIDSVNESGVTLWRFPRSLDAVLPAAIAQKETFALYAAANPPATLVPSSQLPAVAFRWTLSVNFSVRRIPLPNPSKQGPSYLDYTYEVGAVGGADLLRLQSLIGDIALGTNSVTKLEVGFAVPGGTGSTGSGAAASVRQLHLSAVDFIHTFLLQSDVASEVMAAGSTPPKSAKFTADCEGVVRRLWVAGATRARGYYLYHCSQPAQGNPTGLPDTLFDSAGHASLNLIVHLGALADYATGVRTVGYPAQGGTQKLYVAAPQLSRTTATIEPGNIGLQVSRPQPQPVSKPGAAPVYSTTLDNLYTLFTVNMTAPFVGPATTLAPKPGSPSSSAAPLVYEHVFPCVPPFSGGAVPPPSQNPYLYIGQSATYNVVPTDLFGNLWAPSAQTFSQLILYTDPVVSLLNLPYLHLNYSFSGTGAAAVLQVNFVWNAPTYTSAKDPRRAKDLAAYAKACYQLSQSLNVAAQIGVSIQSSIGVATLTGGAAILSSNLQAIYAALASQTTIVAPTLAPLQATLVTSSFNTALYYPLEVSLTLARPPASIDPEFQGVPEVLSSTIMLSPQTASSGVGAASLRAFADAFESAFAAQNWKLALGAAIDSAGASSHTRQIWVVAYRQSATTPGAGLNIAFASAAPQPATVPPAYYAPQPLSNQLLACPNVTIPTLDSSGAISKATQVVAVADVDLDAEMKAFLAAVDTLLSAELMVPAALINAQAVTSLSASKVAIVSKLLAYVTDLSSGASYNPQTDLATSAIGVAAGKYRQECLSDLGNFYKMSSVVVVPASIAFGGAPPPETLNMFGTPLQTGNSGGAGASSEFSLTTGTGALPAADGMSYVAFGLFPKHASSAAQYKATLEFKLGALEHRLATVMVDREPYTAGPWLKFINEPAAIAVGDVAIPIPLRSFPVSPHLTRQYAVPLSQTHADQNKLMRSTKCWSLNGDYSHAFVAQDAVYLTAAINTGLEALPPESDVTDATTGNLLDALIAFRMLRPALQAIFDGATGGPSLAGIRTPQEAGALTTLSNALASFAHLASTITSSTWTATGASSSSAASLDAAGSVGGTSIQPGPPTRLVSTYSITEAPAIATGGGEIWTATISSQDADSIGFLPQISIPGYSTIPNPPVSTTVPPGSVLYGFRDSLGNFLTPAVAESLADRTAIVAPSSLSAGTPLIILDRQNGLLSMQIVRNAALPAPFRYQTPEVAYKSVLSPLLDTSVEINIAGLGIATKGQPQSRNLRQHLCGLFQELLWQSGGTAQVAGSFQAVVSFEYPSSAAGLLPPISMPVMFRLPTPVTYQIPSDSAEPAVYALHMAQRIRRWLNANDLSQMARPGLWSQATIVFDISLYGDASATGEPILRLRNLLLPCAFITA